MTRAGRRASANGKPSSKPSGRHSAVVQSAQEERKAAAEHRKTAKIEKQAQQAEQKAREKGEHGRVTPGNAKKLLGVAKILGPPLAPYLAAAAGAARERYDRMRARRLGVAVEDIGQYTGHGAALHARIAGDHRALTDLRQQAAYSNAEEKAATEQFAERTGARLEQLTGAVRAAERLPTARRRAAHRAVAEELARLEDELLGKFGI
ncbi:DUF6474 family protein [Bounagaea algeriensis]